MSWLNDSGQIIPEARLRALRAEQEKQRILQEAAAIEAAKKMGILDDNGNPVGETEEPPSPEAEAHVSGWPTDAQGNLLEPPPKPAGSNGTAAHVDIPRPAAEVFDIGRPDPVDTVECIRRLCADKHADPMEILELVKDVLERPHVYRLIG